MPRIVTLVENTSASPEYRSRHGLSLYIETEKHRILFDVGPDKLFLENAGKKDIDISKIDTVIISHGHKDHGGALRYLMDYNSSAKIYIRREAFEPHYIKVLGIPVSVGLEAGLLESPQIVLTGDEVRIDEEMLLFSKVEADRFLLRSNRVLYRKEQGRLAADNFAHEQSLILSVEGTRILFAGCSHAGIVNIQSRAEELAAADMTAVVGGFHLYNPPTGKYEPDGMIDRIADELKKTKSTYYTCHCTGARAYERMKGVLGERLKYLRTGAELKIG